MRSRGLLTEAVMKTGVVALALLFAVAVDARAAETKRLVVDGDSKVRVEGKATGRDFRCDVPEPKIEVRGDAVASASELAQIVDAVKQMTFDVPAQRLDCDDGTPTRRKLTGIQGKDERAMRFALTRYEMGPATGTTVPMRLVGEVSFAGKTRPVEVEAQATKSAGGSVRVEGSYPLKLTDWGAESSRLRLGTVQVSDDLVLRFDLALKPE